MHTLFSEYLATLTALHEELKRSLIGLPPEALDWSPGPELNSLAVLAVHVAGAESYWVGEVVGGHSVGRDRATEFATQQFDVASLMARLDASLDLATVTLTDLDPETVSELRVSPVHKREQTVAWALYHALEHTAQHVGHAQMTRQLWNQRHAGQD